VENVLDRVIEVAKMTNDNVIESRDAYLKVITEMITGERSSRDAVSKDEAAIKMEQIKLEDKKLDLQSLEKSFKTQMEWRDKFDAATENLRKDHATEIRRREDQSRDDMLENLDHAREQVEVHTANTREYVKLFQSSSSSSKSNDEEIYEM